jgi:tetratricopeptide (TPR) repeat protein
MCGRRRIALVVALAAAAAGAPAWAEQPEAPLDRARRLHGEGRLEEALAAYRRVDDADPAAGAVAHNNTCVLLIDLGRHSEALAECERALELRRAAPADERGLGRTLNNLGLALQHLGRYRESRRRFGEALAINRRRGDAEGEAINLSNLAVSATYEGDYSWALGRLERTAALIDLHSDAPWAAEQRTVERINRGVVLEKLGAYREALAIYRGLLAGGEGGGAGGGGRLDPGRRAVLETDTGVIYPNLGDPVRAVTASSSSRGRRYSVIASPRARRR